MDKDYILSVANTIRNQILATTTQDIIQSWGVSEPIATLFNDMPAFAFLANGRLFQGIVIIAYNPSDLYELHLHNKSSQRCVSNDVYADQLGELIDINIERGNNIEEYNAFCEKQRQLLFSGNFLSLPS